MLEDTFEPLSVLALQQLGLKDNPQHLRFHFAHHNEHEVDDDDNECEVDDDGNDDDDDDDDDEYKMRCMSNLQQQA